MIAFLLNQHSSKACEAKRKEMCYPMPAPSSRTSFSLTDGSIPKTSGCSCCVRTSALLSSIISSTLCAVECLFQNSVICSRVWGLGSTRSVTEIAEMLNHHMTWMAPHAISLENRMKRKSRIWGPYAMRQVIGVRAGGARRAAAPPNFGQLRFFGQQEKIWAKPFFKDVSVFFLLV